MHQQLEDRVEYFESIIKGACSCGEPVNAILNSSCSCRLDKVRYTYPDRKDAWNIFRCRNCREVISKSFKYTPPPLVLETFI